MDIKIRRVDDDEYNAIITWLPSDASGDLADIFRGMETDLVIPFDIDVVRDSSDAGVEEYININLDIQEIDSGILTYQMRKHFRRNLATANCFVDIIRRVAREYIQKEINDEA